MKGNSLSKPASIIAALLIIFYCTLGAHYYFFRHKPEEPLPFAASADEKELLRSLAWYAENVLSALRPEEAVLVFLEENREGCRGTCVSGGKKLEALKIIERCRPPLQNEEVTLQIARRWRSGMWWPGVPYARNVFLYSPYSYEITGIDAVNIAKNDGVEQAQVVFNWRKKSFSPLFLRLVEEGLAEGNIDREEFPGQIVSHQATLIKSMYGFFLPLGHEPWYELARMKEIRSELPVCGSDERQSPFEGGNPKQH